jgi:type IV pilus assembly protein PilW
MSNQKGFTLVELLVAMAIAGIVMAAGYSMYISQQKAYQTTEEVTALQQNLRSAMYFIEHDMRMAGYNPTRSSQAFSFTDVASDRCTFLRDDPINPDGVLQNESERISYFLSGNTLRKGYGLNPGEGQTIADNITGLSFTWFNKDGGPAANVTEIRRVEVILTGTDGMHTRQLSSMINCRNMGL